MIIVDELIIYIVVAWKKLSSFFKKK